MWCLLKTLVLFVLVCKTVSQFPNWLIDTVGVSMNLPTTSPTWIDTFQLGDPTIGLSTGLTNTDKAIFSVASCSSSQQSIDNIRLFTKTGQLSLTFKTNHYGAAFSFVKNNAGAQYVIACSIKGPSSPSQHLVIQALTVSGNIFSVSGTPRVITTFPFQSLTDRPGSIWFYGAAGRRVVRISAVDGTSTQSANIGPTTFGVYLLMDLPSTNVLLVWFSFNNALVSVNRGTVASIKTQTLTGDSINKAILDQSTETIIWSLKWTPTDKNNLQKRGFNAAVANMMTIQATSSFTLDFYYGDLSQLGTFGMVMVTPYHLDFYTSSSTAGFVYFVRTSDMALIPCKNSNQFQWYFQTFGNQLLNDVTEDSGKRFYMGFMDGTTQNFWTGYMLVDTCMSPLDSSLSCTNCPIGYWRLGTSFGGLRKCLSPPNFPAISGMKNGTMTCESCLIANCVKCLYDHTTCALCDTANGYYLNDQVTPMVCLQSASFPVGLGIDPTQNKLVACADVNCKECQADYRVCNKCDTANDWYLQDPICVTQNLIPAKFGRNIATGKIVDCASTGCIDCRADYTICARCDSKATFYLDTATNQCKSTVNFAVGTGADKFSLVIKPCQDTMCQECKLDWKICTQCKQSSMVIQDGKCKQITLPSGGSPTNGQTGQTGTTDSDPANDAGFEATEFLEPAGSRYFINNYTATIQFSSSIQLIYQGFFTDAFNLTLKDSLNNRSFTCQDPLLSTALLRCSVAVFGSVLTVRLASDVKITVGKLSLTLMNEGLGSSGRALAERSLQSTALTPVSAIVDAATGTIFTSYPLTVDGVSTQADPYLFWAAQPLSQAKNIRPITGVLFAALSVSLSVLLDKQIANLEYLAVLEGPILVYPQQVFDLVGAASLFWPTELFGAPDWLTEVSRVSTCRPTTAFERQGYQCGLLGSLGVDLYMGLMIALVCLLITLIANKLIDQRARQAALNERVSEEHRELLASTDRSPSNRLKSESGIALNRSVKEVAKHTAKIPVLRSSEPGSNIETSSEPESLSQRLRCLPTGEVVGSIASDSTVLRTAWWRETYGITFMFARVEASELKLMVFIALNCWNATSGIFEQYSLIAAIIFTLYYIFQGYFTYQFATCIWEEVQKMTRLAPTQVPGDNPGSGGQQQTTPRPQNLRLLLPEVLLGPNKDVRAVLFDSTGVPTELSHVLGPVVWQTRCLLLSIVAVGLASSAIAQVILALIVEIAYLVFIINSSKPHRRAKTIMELICQPLICLYLLGKLVTLGGDFSEQTNQKIVGYILAWILLAYAAVSVIMILYLVAVHLKNLLAKAPGIMPSKSRTTELASSNGPTKKFLTRGLTRLGVKTENQQPNSAPIAKLSRLGSESSPSNFVENT